MFWPRTHDCVFGLWVSKISLLVWCFSWIGSSLRVRTICLSVCRPIYLPTYLPDSGKDWRREEKGMTEDEMVGWHHRLNGDGLLRVWVNSASWWWTGRPGMLQSMGVAKSRTRLSDWTERNCTEPTCRLIISLFDCAPIWAHIWNSTNVCWVNNEK